MRFEPWLSCTSASASSASSVVDDGRQRLVVDVDELGRVLGEVERLGDDERDGVADETHLVVGERRARRLRARPDRPRCATAP